jgi:hypothetical protein
MRIVWTIALLALLFSGGVGLGHITRDTPSQAPFAGPRALDTPAVAMPIPRTPTAIARYPRAKKTAASQPASSGGSSSGSTVTNTVIAPVAPIVPPPPPPPPPAAASGARPYGITIK